MTDRSSKRRSRFKRWFLLLTFGLVFVAIALVASLPFLLETEPARQIILREANRKLAPSTVDIARFRFSWFAPTRFEKLLIKDDDGKTMVSAPNVVWKKSLAQIVSSPKGVGTIRLERPSIDIEKHPDGTINLSKTLSRAKSKGTHIEIVDGSMKISAPELAEPIEATKVNGTIDRPSNPESVKWSLELANETKPGSPWLKLEGRVAGAPERLGSSQYVQHRRRVEPMACRDQNQEGRGEIAVDGNPRCP